MQKTIFRQIFKSGKIREKETKYNKGKEEENLKNHGKIFRMGKLQRKIQRKKIYKNRSSRTSPAKSCSRLKTFSCLLSWSYL